MVTGTEPTKSPTSNGVAAQAAALQQTLLAWRTRDETLPDPTRPTRLMGHQNSRPVEGVRRR